MRRCNCNDEKVFKDTYSDLYKYIKTCKCIVNEKNNLDINQTATDTSLCRPPKSVCIDKTAWQTYYEGHRKQINNTGGYIAVPESLYLSNLGSANAYQKPTHMYHLVQQNNAWYMVPKSPTNWNQMSDRRLPSKYDTALRFTNKIGVDIKHNSYYRYLNRLKCSCK